MKKLLVLTLIFYTFLGYSQEANVVELISVGRGKTQDQALQNAMRNAIEQSFGVFVSTKTEILNDELIKDQIVSVSNGSIQKYEIISERSLSDDNHAVTIKASVSINKLISFVQGKGVSADFNGSLFSFNIRQQELNEKNEKVAINDMISVIKQLVSNSLDYNIIVSNPVRVLPEEFQYQERFIQYQERFKNRNLNQNNKDENWYIPIRVEITTNENFKLINTYLYENLTALSLSAGEANNYLSLKKNVFPIEIDKSTSKKTRILLRTEESITSLFNNLSYLFYDQALSFSIAENNIGFNYMPSFSKSGIFDERNIIKSIKSDFSVVPYHLYENGEQNTFNIFGGYYRKYMSEYDVNTSETIGEKDAKKSINNKLKFTIPLSRSGSYYRNSIDLLKYIKTGYHIADINYYFKFDLDAIKNVSKFTITKIMD